MKVIKKLSIPCLAIFLFLALGNGLEASQGHEGHGHSDILFHPYLVHFPIAFFFLEGFLLLLWKIKKEDQYERFAYLILCLGLIMIIPTMIAGYIDAGFSIPLMVRTHFFSALSLLIINSIRFFLRRSLKIKVWQGELRYIYTILLILSIILSGLTGHWGGQLAHM